MTRKTTLQNTAGGVGTTAGASAAADPAQKFLDTFLKATRKQDLKDQTQIRVTVGFATSGAGHF